MFNRVTVQEKTGGIVGMNPDLLKVPEREPADGEIGGPINLDAGGDFAAAIQNRNLSGVGLPRFSAVRFAKRQGVRAIIDAAHQKNGLGGS